MTSLLHLLNWRCALEAKTESRSWLLWSFSFRIPLTAHCDRELELQFFFGNIKFVFPFTANRCSSYCCCVVRKRIFLCVKFYNQSDSWQSNSLSLLTQITQLWYWLQSKCVDFFAMALHLPRKTANSTFDKSRQVYGSVRIDFKLFLWNF